MANVTINVRQREWKLLTDSDITSARFQVLATPGLFIQGSNGTDAPTTTQGAIFYEHGEGEVDRALSEIFPGITDANRLWAFMPHGSGAVSVSHA